MRSAVISRAMLALGTMLALGLSTSGAAAAVTTNATQPAETTRSATVNVRIEGATETLFEGPVATEGGYVKASSDSRWRKCDGTNNGANSKAGPTATKAAVDAMQIVDQTFDASAQWWDEFGDYFIERFGPDTQNADNNWYWGILVNDAFTSVGGCQYEVKADDQVLWDYNAFASGIKGFLKLEPAGDGMTASAPATVDVAEGQPLRVQVDSYSGDSGQSYIPVAGMTIAPVTTAANGFEMADTSSSQAVTTDSSGQATVTFTTTGWHRIKAQDPTDSASDPDGDYGRSNRLDVCVEVAGETQEQACGPLPADDQVRSLPTPAVTKLSQSHRRWREGRKLASIARQSKRAPVGTVFRFTLNEAATVKLAFTHKIAGRRVRGRCVASSKANHRKAQCRRTVTVGSLSLSGRPGVDRVSFAGWISRAKKLKSGRYSMVLTAIANGKTSAAHRLVFTIVNKQ